MIPYSNTYPERAILYPRRIRHAVLVHHVSRYRNHCGCTGVYRHCVGLLVGGGLRLGLLLAGYRRQLSLGVVHLWVVVGDFVHIDDADGIDRCVRGSTRGKDKHNRCYAQNQKVSQKQHESLLIGLKSKALPFSPQARPTGILASMEGGTNVRITHIPTRGTVGAFGPLRACGVLALALICAFQDRRDLEGDPPAVL